MASKLTRPYRYRNLPCNIRPDDALWCVSGTDANGAAGVLEWCYDEKDARLLCTFMSHYAQFSNLSYARYTDSFDSAT